MEEPTKRIKAKFEVYEASFNAAPTMATEGFGHDVSKEIVQLPMTTSEPIIA